MPFNGSGVFERVYDWTTDRDNGTKILADRVDTETDGIVAGINDVVDGTQGFIGPVRGTNGTAASPAFSFTDDPDTGAYRVSANVLGFSVSGTLEMKVEAGYVDAVNGLKIGGTAVTSTAAELNILDGVTATAAELNYTDGVTSNIQTQLNAKAPTASPTFTGNVTVPEVTETVYSLTGTDVDPANGTVQTLALSADRTLTESLATGQAVRLLITGGDTYTVTWPAGIEWVDGSAPTLTAKDLVTLEKIGSDLIGYYGVGVA